MRKEKVTKNRTQNKKLSLFIFQIIIIRSVFISEKYKCVFYGFCLVARVRVNFTLIFLSTSSLSSMINYSTRKNFLQNFIFIANMNESLKLFIAGGFHSLNINHTSEIYVVFFRNVCEKFIRNWVNMFSNFRK